MSIVSEDIYKQLYATGTGPGILYGLPKIHKTDFSQNFQFRPIFAAYNTASYNLSKFLVPILSPYTNNAFTVKNSYTFVEDITKYSANSKLYMASFDVTNLFTNIPLHETISIILDKLFFNPNVKVIGFTRTVFKTLLEHSVLNILFLFNDKLYKQIEGLGMGLPLGPTFANIFMCFYEELWLDRCPDSFKPLFYRRYVDDTFVLFRDKSHVTLFLDFLNSQHRNIHFTVEEEQNNTIAFLDVRVTRNDDNSFSTSVYRKSTFTGLGMSYFSFCCRAFKINAIKTLLYRAYNISSNFCNIHSEFQFLTSFFVSNGFPSGLIQSHIKRFLSNIFNPPIRTAIHDKTFYLSLPYFGPQSNGLRKDLLKFLTKYCPNVNFKIILSNRQTIGSLFRYKDSLPPLSRSSLVYQFECPACGARYVGSTARCLHNRVAEHRGISPRTGRPLATPGHSSIRQHCRYDCDAPIRDFSILGSTNNRVSLLILESLHIFKTSPKLNDMHSAHPLHIVR